MVSDFQEPTAIEVSFICRPCGVCNEEQTQKWRCKEYVDCDLPSMN